MTDEIIVRGAREHNLKNINVNVPKNKFVVITGVSGSGKSSFAFDTLYAEGQRRYVESLSAYARQFLGVMDKPDVDSIEGLSPSISIDQKSTSHNPRSTVGTITEIYDYFRLLFARVGHPHCPNCNIEISKLSLDEIVSKIFSCVEEEVKADKVKPHVFAIYSPVIRQKKGEFQGLFENIRSKGYTELRLDGRITALEENIALIKSNKHDIDVLIDSITLSFRDLKNEVFSANLHSRLAGAVEQATSLAGGLAILKGTKEHLFSEKFACPKCSLALPEIEPRMFSFNSPMGACETCKGIGTIYKVDPDLILNKRLSVLEGAILPFNKIFFYDTWYFRLLKKAALEEGIDLAVPVDTLPSDKLKMLLYGTQKVYRVTGMNREGRSTAIFESFTGVVAELERKFFDADSGAETFETQKYIREETCTACLGKRLKKEILSITIDKKNISQLADMGITQLTSYIKDSLTATLNPWEQQVARSIIKEIATRLMFLKNVGLGYLTISRAARTLSGGELQRIRLASQIGSGLTGVMYVLDEPSIGLHPKDVKALITTLHNLKDLGNTLLVVEHDRETIESADWLLELGPKAGREGGKVVFSGTIPQMLKSKDSLTGKYLSGKKTILREAKTAAGHNGEIILTGASQFNLKDITTTFPLGNLIAVTGVSGSGKSTLIVETLYPALKYYLEGHFSDSVGDFKRLEGYQYTDRVYLVEQSPIGRTPRSNPATYVGFFDEIRDIFAQTTDAKAKGFKKGRFSFNLKGGRCEKCQGAGVVKIEMQFLPDVYVTCDVCEGARYNKETIEIKFKGKSIYEVLDMTIEESCDFFQNHFRIFQKLSFLRQVGLGYIKLGQPAPTFSGGEAQRIKLANELSRRNSGRTVYILDEPTTGLHFWDIEKLLHTLHQLVQRGNTVIVIEHNLDVIKNCDYIIDLGPDGGEEGGRIVYQGALDGIVKQKSSYTGQYLSKVF